MAGTSLDKPGHDSGEVVQIIGTLWAGETYCGGMATMA